MKYNYQRWIRWKMEFYLHHEAGYAYLYKDSEFIGFISGDTRSLNEDEYFLKMGIYMQSSPQVGRITTAIKNLLLLQVSTSICPPPIPHYIHNN
jgi:hypothetical protein